MAEDHLVQGPAAVMRAMVSIFASGDLSKVEAVVHTDYVDHQGLGAGPIRGPDGFATVVRAARSNYEVLDVVLQDLIEGHDRSAARLRWRGIRLSGESVERESIDIVRVEDGRAVEHWGGRS